MKRVVRNRLLMTDAHKFCMPPPPNVLDRSQSFSPLCHVMFQSAYRDCSRGLFPRVRTKVPGPRCIRVTVASRQDKSARSALYAYYRCLASGQKYQVCAACTHACSAQAVDLGACSEALPLMVVIPIVVMHEITVHWACLTERAALVQFIGNKRDTKSLEIYVAFKSHDRHNFVNKNDL